MKKLFLCEIDICHEHLFWKLLSKIMIIEPKGINEGRRKEKSWPSILKARDTNEIHQRLYDTNRYFGCNLNFLN